VNKSKADGNVFNVGVDVHKNYLQVAVLEEKGSILNNSKVDNNLVLQLGLVQSSAPFLCLAMPLPCHSYRALLYDALLSALRVMLV
jgi:hypothetical protein